MPEEKVMTLEEFLEMKRQEARQMALANSYNATEPRLAKKYYTEEDYNDLSDKISYKEDDINLTKHSISVLENKLYNPILLYKGIGQINPRLRYKSNKLKDYGEQLIDELDNLYNHLNNDEKELINYNDRLKFVKENGYDWSGYNCITNASGWYGDDYVCASNIQFAKDPTKYGFIEINPNDALPGDIFQYLGHNNIPTHATMYSKKNDKGEVLTNYAPGSYNRKIQKDSGYYSTGDRAFRFVGLPEDIEAWTQEYNDTYKKLGGMKKVRKKKMLGAAIIGAATSLIGTGLNLAQQKKLHDEQMAQQKEQMNIANANARIANLNQLANNDMSWAYNKFNNFRCGGKKRMKANLGKFKPRFDK